MRILIEYQSLRKQGGSEHEISTGKCRIQTLDVAFVFSLMIVTQYVRLDDTAGWLEV